MLDDFQKAVEQRDWFLCRKYLRDALSSLESQRITEITLIWIDTYINFLLKDYSERGWIDDMYLDTRDSLTTGVLRLVPSQLNQASKSLVINSVKNVLRNLRGLAVSRLQTKHIEFAGEAIISVITARLLIEKYLLSPELAELHNAPNKSPQTKMNAQVILAIKIANHPDILALEQRLWSNLIRILSAYI